MPLRKMPTSLLSHHSPTTHQIQTVNEYHAKMINEFRNVFDTHKAAYGWPNKRLVVV